jgi:hypothetical protein
MSVPALSKSDKGIAVVTGASSGIGKVYADRLAKRGYNLLLIARRGDRLEELAQQLRKDKDQAVTVETLVADLGNSADLKKVADTIAADNRITMLVNNAGTSKFASSTRVPLADVDQQMDVNSRALTQTTATEIWDVAGVGLKALDPATIMTAEDCVDAALAGLDRGETVTLPSVDDPQLWAAFDEARLKLFAASQTGKPASRYGITK